MSGESEVKGLDNHWVRDNGSISIVVSGVRGLFGKGHWQGPSMCLV